MINQSYALTAKKVYHVAHTTMHTIVQTIESVYSMKVLIYFCSFKDLTLSVSHNATNTQTQTHNPAKPQR